MARPPKLTETQKARLATLEPALRNAVRLADYEAAKKITVDIQSVLRASGHETRLMQAKNWLFEAAMEAGRLDIAEAGFAGVRQKTSRGTRVHLEATALLAICYLRKNDLLSAEPLIADTLAHEKNISSETRRKQFVRRIVARFHEEAALASLRNAGREVLEIDDVHAAAGQLVRTATEDEMLIELGRSLPPATIALLLKVDQLAKKQLPPKDVKYLPSPEDLQQQKELGATVFTAIKRVIYRSICDPKSEVYRAWFNNGMMAVLDKKYFAATVIAALTSTGACVKMLAASATALLIKMGLEVYCEKFKPDSVMISVGEKD